MRGYKAYIGRTVIVSTSSFDVRALLSSVGGGVMVLREAVQISDMGNAPIDGTLLVPEGQIRYVQVV